MENATVLIVDDEANFVAALKGALEAKSWQAVLAGDRSQAQLTMGKRRPDAIVLGTIMPRGDAFLFHKWVRGTPLTSEIPLVVVDAPYEKQFLCGWRRDEGMQCDADDYLMKPVSIPGLIYLLERLLEKATTTIKVLVADDHKLVRDGIRAVLTLERDIQVVGEASNGQEALEKTIELTPDVVLMDILMPVMNGLEATKNLCKACPLAKVLVLTQYNDDENLVAAGQAGALGFIPKTAASSQLLAGIRSVSEGKKFIQRN